MKLRIANLAFLAAAYLAMVVVTLSFTGCIPAGNPVIAADNAALVADKIRLDDLGIKLAALTAKLAATTQPADATALTAQIAEVKQQVLDVKNKQSADTAYLASDTNTIKTTQVQQGTKTVQDIAAIIPGPWGQIASALIGLAGVGIVAYMGKSSAATSSANHAATIQKAIQDVANSVPVSALPTNLQGIARTVIHGVDVATTPPVTVAVSPPVSSVSITTPVPPPAV